MSWLAKQMKWLMLVSGVLTCTMVYAAIAPQKALRSNFGSTLEGPVAEIVVRNWGAFIALVLAFGRELLVYQVSTAVVVDAVWVVVFSVFLLGTKHPAT